MEVRKPGSGGRAGALKKPDAEARRGGTSFLTLLLPRSLRPCTRV